jgi:hypothetical protein
MGFGVKATRDLSDLSHGGEFWLVAELKCGSWFAEILRDGTT